jgi:hypothetical protein
MACIRDSSALVGFVGRDSFPNIHYCPHCPVGCLVCAPDSMIHMTFAEEAVMVVTNMAVGHWCRSRNRSYCSMAGMPCVPVVGSCRLGRFYLSSPVQD